MTETQKNAQTQRQKNFTVPVAVFVAIVGCILAVNANVTTQKVESKLIEERQKRLAAEKALQEAQASVLQLQQQLETARNKIKDIEKVLSEGQTQRSSLQTQMLNLQKEKEQLQQKVESLRSQSEAAVDQVTNTLNQ